MNNPAWKHGTMRLTAALLGGIACLACVGAAVGATEDARTPATAEHAAHELGGASGVQSGLPHGIPRLCADAGVHALRSGHWSSASTWSTGKVPSAGATVLIGPGVDVIYDVQSDAALNCIDVEGGLRFSTARATRLKVGTLTVLPTGTLEIGTESAPIPAALTAELIFADMPLDTRRDPEQFGIGLIGLGTVSLHGAPRIPTFVRLAAEPLKGATQLQLEKSVAGWRVGDKLVLPDTRQLLTGESRAKYRPEWESPRVVAIDGRNITLSAALDYDHRGARDGAGRTEFLPHVGNVTRNVVLRSENPQGTRGHVIFSGRPDIDIRYALFQGLGRTQLGVLDNVQYGADGQATHVGDNQIGRYSLHFHHVFGPVKPQKNGYQFTVIGNAVDDASKWGITVHNSHYGLIRDNVVYDSRGAGIVTEDGTESFNVFAHNLALRSQGSGEFAPSSGYGGAAPDPGGEGAGFWFRGPNNIIRDNVAANTEVFGFGIAAGALGEVRIPKFQGADTSQEDGYVLSDTTAMPLLEFTHNEAYGAIQTGVAIGWNAKLQDTRVWHTTLNAVTAFPADWLTIERLTVRGDPAVLAHEFETPTGVWFGDYTSKTILVQDADVQGMRVGVESPFFMTAHGEPGRGKGEVTVEGGYLRDYVGVAVGTTYVDPNRASPPVKRAVVRNTRFDALNVAAMARYAPAAISMNYGTSGGDRKLRVPLEVYGYNTRRDDNFRIFYSNEIPAAAAPCTGPTAGIDGFACRVTVTP
jgi:hypothetical protein